MNKLICESIIEGDLDALRHLKHRHWHENATPHCCDRCGESLAQERHCDRCNRTLSMFNCQYQGLCALSWAVVEDQEEIVRFLITEGCVDVEQKTPPGTRRESGQTPLMLAAADGNVQLVRVLLELGADVNATNTSKKNVLMKSVICGHAEIVSLLLSEGADVTNQTVTGETVWHAAAEHGHVDILRLLLDLKEGRKGVNARDCTGNTPLHYACQRDRSGECTRILLGNGANVRATADHNVTPFALASRQSVSRRWLRMATRTASVHSAFYCVRRALLLKSIVPQLDHYLICIIARQLWLKEHVFGVVDERRVRNAWWMLYESHLWPFVKFAAQRPIRALSREETLSLITSKQWRDDYLLTC